MKEEDFSEKKASSGMSELARKILLTGVGAIFMTEEGVRKTLSDLKVPKDAMGGLLDSLKKQKDEIFKIVVAELTSFFSKIKVHEELQKALKGMEIHVDAKISFDKKALVGEPAISVKRVLKDRLEDGELTKKQRKN